MNRQEFLDFIKSKQEDGLALINSKSADYAGEDKPFKNFDNVETICNIPSEVGILVRMSDKITRIGNLLNKEADVNNESIEDTLLDLANYAYILLAKIYGKEQKNE